MVDIEHLRKWVGNTESMSEEVERWPVTAMLATLDVDPSEWPAKGDPIPPTGHWNYFVPRVGQSRIGADGHPLRGDFLPPVDLPRRMWAGSRISYGPSKLRLGDEVSRVSSIRSVDLKQGRSGSLVFVTVGHVYRTREGIAVEEEQDLVYRDNPPPTVEGTPKAPKSAPDNPQWNVEIATDAPLLFRYSAVTFNAHRIHYDAPYAREQEGYPGLVVHGQLIATFLIEAWRRNNPGQELKAFSFRSMSPLFCGDLFSAEGRVEESGAGARLWARTEQGGLVMDATVECAK